MGEQLFFVSGKDGAKVSFLFVMSETKGGANRLEGFIKGEIVLAGVKLRRK